MFNIDEIYTVSNFIKLCKNSIEENIPYCWLQGEISNLSKPSSGHWYFSIKDDKSSIRCALFRLNKRKIIFEPENGMSVIIRGAATIYETRGDFQIVVQKIEPNGIGSLQMAFEKLKTKLYKEGLFKIENKKQIPKYIKSVAIVSSANGAVIHDIINIIRKRFPLVEIKIYDTIVQGSNIHKKIIKALKSADENKNNEIIILARGGGSIEDLWAFNEESLARAIYSCKKPIISAIGHETDTTISDFVADARAPTPTAAATMITPDIKDIFNLLLTIKNQISSSLKKQIQNKILILEQFNLRIINPKKDLQIKMQILDDLELKLNHSIKTINTLNQNNLNILNIELNKNSIKNLINQKIEKNHSIKKGLYKIIFKYLEFYDVVLKKHNNNLYKNINNIIYKNNLSLENKTKNLNILSPLSTLSRGYSITQDNKGNLIQNSYDVKTGDIIKTKLKTAQIISKVYKITKI